MWNVKSIGMSGGRSNSFDFFLSWLSFGISLSFGGPFCDLILWFVYSSYLAILGLLVLGLDRVVNAYHDFPYVITLLSSYFL